MSILFTTIVSHGFIPDEFMKTVLLPIIKSKTGDVHDVNNYRPIALVTTCSKLFELLLLDFLDIYLQTMDNQFGFKSKHATDKCIFAIKNVIEYYTSQNGPVYTCFLDASKAFDHVNHWTLFTKLINRKVPLLFVRIIVFWYRAQLFCITWGSCMSDSFRITNGVRQGGIRLVNKVIEVIDCSQLRCNSNSNRLKFFKCNSNRLKFYLLHLLLSIIFLLQFTLCYFSEGGCRKMITLHGL